MSLAHWCCQATMSRKSSRSWHLGPEARVNVALHELSRARVCDHSPAESSPQSDRQHAILSRSAELPCACPVLHGGGTRDLAQGMKLADFRSKLLSHAINQVLLAGIRREIGQGQHRQRRMVPGSAARLANRHFRKRPPTAPAGKERPRLPSRTCVRVTMASATRAQQARSQRADEPISPTRQSFNKARVLRRVAQHLANLVDRRVQVVVNVDEGVRP